MSKVGVFSGTFDPVHGGHIAFALAAAEEAELEKVYFLPEPVPRRKEGVTHYAHRVAMLRLALRPHRRLALMELPDKQFTAAKTLPRLKKTLPNDELHLLLGSDMLKYLDSKDWPGTDMILGQMRLVVGVRAGQDTKTVRRALAALQQNGVLVMTHKAHASSRDIRTKLLQGQGHAELLPSLRPYVMQNWLYTSVSR